MGRQRLPRFVQRHGTKFRGWYSEAGRKTHLPARDTPEEAHRDAVKMRERIEAVRGRALSGRFVTIGQMLDRLAAEAAREGTRRWWKDEKTYICNLFAASTPLHLIDRPALERFIALRQDDGVSASTISHHRRALNRCFVVALQDGLVDSNPVPTVRWPKFRRKPVAFMTWAEIVTRFKQIRELGGEQIDIDLFTIVALTGLRRAEVERLRVEDIDLDAGLLVTDGKRRDEHAAIHPEVVPALERRIEAVGSGPLFPSLNWIKRRFRVWSQKLGEPRWKCHTLGRHSLATNAVLMGVDAATIKRMLRHASIVTTEQYIHLAAEDARRGLKKMRLSGHRPESRRAADDVQTDD